MDVTLIALVIWIILKVAMIVALIHMDRERKSTIMTIGKEEL